MVIPFTSAATTQTARKAPPHAGCNEKAASAALRDSVVE